MYLQEIVISPDILEKISKEILIDFKSYVDNLTLKIILLDKDNNKESKIENEFNNIIKLSNNDGKNKIDYILKIFLKPNMREYRNVQGSKNYCKDEIKNQVLSLSLLSESKIINSEDKSSLALQINHPELEHIEILNFEEFISPPSCSNLFSKKRKIEVEQGKAFEFEKKLFPYLCDSKKIIINDRYLRNRNRGYMILKKLIRLCTKLKSLTIYTIVRDEPTKDKFDMTFEDFTKALKEECPNINVSIQKTNNKIGKTRFIDAENFKLYFQPGIDFVNEKYIAQDNPVIIDIEYKPNTNSSFD